MQNRRAHWASALLAGFALSAQAHVTETEVTFKKIQKLIVDNRLTSLDDLLPLLPENYRRHYTLMYGSHSRQQASPDSPRVILYGRDAKTIITFNGDPSQKGYDDLEVMEFNDSTKTFTLREVHFPPRRSTAKVHFSEPNPPRCLTCHQKDPRPNWSEYNVWPGAYGAQDDMIQSRYSDEGPRGTGNAYPTLNREFGHFRELESFLAFKKRAASHPRYRHLVTPKAEKTNPYFPYYGVPKDPKMEVDDYRNRNFNRMPNTQLTIHLVNLNAQRLHRKMKQSPFFDKYKYAATYLLWHCNSPIYPTDNNFPATWRNLRTELERDIRRTRTVLYSPSDNRQVSLEEFLRSRFAFRTDTETHMMLQLLRVDDRNDAWLGFGDKVFEDSEINKTSKYGIEFNAGGGQDGVKQSYRLARALYRDLITEEPKLAGFIKPQPYKTERIHTADHAEVMERFPSYFDAPDENARTRLCYALSQLVTKNYKPNNRASKAVEAADTTPPVHGATASSAEAVEAAHLLNGNCMMCHSHAGAQWYIPFGDEPTLRAHLEANPRLIREILYRTNPSTSAKSRMPYLRAPLSASQYALIQKFLKSISSRQSAPNEPPGPHAKTNSN